ncbi:hypothetical protein D3C87_1761110 [compost metagenome]
MAAQCVHAPRVWSLSVTRVYSLCQPSWLATYEAVATPLQALSREAIHSMVGSVARSARLGRATLPGGSG